MKTPELTVVELCAGAGGQTLGLEMAKFSCVCAVEIDRHACETLRQNRPSLNVLETDIRNITGKEFAEIDLLSAGVPCPPFSIAGKQLGENDDRDLFPEALRLISIIKPKAVMIENVSGFASSKFDSYRMAVIRKLKRLGYDVGWRLLQAALFGVPQLRPRFVLVAMRSDFSPFFRWPETQPRPSTVGETLVDLMAARRWQGALRWAARANDIAPTIVGGSKKHGGPDLGPTRAKAQWLSLGVDGNGIADEAPSEDFPVDGIPKLTNRMAARLQSFPDTWVFSGGKTAVYRQIGNAFPPFVAKAVAESIRKALLREAQPKHDLLDGCLLAERM